MKKNYLKQVLLLIIVALTFTFSGNAQVLINSTGGTPDASAMLEIQSTTQGLLIPRMTTSDR
ncbi:MAG: hypothetical protein K8R54_12495, partial [Bacteroidales bacterium]|nr:hypothetical protein [Bacteroidales bacterium]